MSKPIWMPSPQRIADSNITRLIARVQKNHPHEVYDYPSLYQWSITQPEAFWPEIWRFCNIQASRLWDSVIEHADKMPGAAWFKGSRLNFAENLLQRRDDKAALIFRGENGRCIQISYRELYAQVTILSSALRHHGVSAGDRVAGFMPNTPETVIAMLAATSIGAVWSSCSPDFGSSGVVDRFGQIKPKILFTTDGYFYNGKAIDCLPRIRSILAELDVVQQVIVVPFVQTELDISDLPHASLYQDFVERFKGTQIIFEQLPFDHPLYIMYSSGTTGVPKCIIHSAGGTLIQHLKELVLHTDLKPDDSIFYFTTCGWMMWNWLISSLATGATIILYDGSPTYPTHDSLFDVAEQEKISIFGTSAKFLSATEKAGVKPAVTHDLSALKAILSTGSPLAPESFAYVYRDIKSDVQLSSISGGTDIVSCFALGNPILPVYAGELQCRGLGLKVEVFNEHGESIQGKPGELVCTAPFPAMPTGFWNDPDQHKYHGAYFETFPGIWAHGDYAETTEHGGVIIHGRSDAVLNPGGVRIGTAEIYRQVEKLPEVLESIAVGQEWNNDVRVILFVKLRPAVALNDGLSGRIKTTIRNNVSARHVPAKIIQVADIPRTLSGKIVELTVRDVIHGKPVKNLEALANPDALEHFRNRTELTED